MINRGVKDSLESSLRSEQNHFKLKYWVIRVCAHEDYVCFTVRTFLFQPLPGGVFLCVPRYRPYQQYLHYFPLFSACSTVSQICERPIGPGTDLDLRDICILMSSVQFGTEKGHGIRVTVTF